MTDQAVEQASTAIERKQWRCDVCKTAHFDDFEEACKHEETCQGVPSETKQVSAAAEEKPAAPLENPPTKPKDKASRKRPNEASKNGVDAKATSASHAFFVPQSKKEKRNGNKKAAKSQEQPPANPFFAPRKAKSENNKATQQKPAKNEKRPKEKSSKGTVDLTTSKKSKTSTKQGKKKASVTATNMEDDLTAAPKLASIFQNKSTKQIVAEQRRAEFQAKREAERQREKERQAKRSALFGSGESNNGVQALGGVKRKQQSQSSSRNSSIINQANFPLAPRFPVPNHVTQHGSTTSETETDILPPNHPFRKRTPSEEATSMTIETDSNEWRLVGSELDAIDASTLSKIQVALQQVLIPPPTTQKEQTDNRLWVDKYGMQHGGVVGEAATKTCQQLTEYINHWRRLRKEAVERMAERQRKRKAKFDKALGRKATRKPKKRKKKVHDDDDDDDFLYDDDCWDEDEVDQHGTPLCLLTGPPSSGKTAMLYHVAKQCMCSVVEINTTEIRSGAALKNKIEEATKSSSLDTMLQNQAKATFFGNSTSSSKAVVDSDDEDGDRTPVPSKPNRDEASMTIVLIDEADIVFDAEGDAGFLSALTSLAKTAKSPIILTANHYPAYFHSTSLPCRTFSMDRPRPMECATKLLQICRQEGVELDPEIRKQGHDCMHEKLSDVASSCDCDLRRMIHELQIFSYGHSGIVPSIEGTATPKPSTKAPKSSDWRPTVCSIEPHQVPMDKYTIVTITGRNFNLLRDKEHDMHAWVGNHKCNCHVVNDRKMLLLCPPYSSSEEDGCQTFCSRLMKRVVPLSIECKAAGIFNSENRRVVKIETMVNDAMNIGVDRNLIEYVFPEDIGVREQLTESQDSVEEFELSDEIVEASKPVDVAGLCLEGNEQGEALWDRTISGLTDGTGYEDSATILHLSADDVESLESLRAASSDASMLSDAAFLDDFQRGIPMLAGSCPGFGFDCTEECLLNSNDGDKLRFHENSRPPREEKLFELGWKGDCYFYGDPETYMTTLSMKLGKNANYVMDHFRGRDSAIQGFPTAVLTVDAIETREDLDFMAHLEQSADEEDSYLHRQIPAAVLSFPEMLRTKVKGNHTDPLHQSLDLDKRRSETMARLEDNASYILPLLCERLLWSYGRFGLQSEKEQQNLVLELLPMLRRIGLYEQAAEFVELQKGEEAAANPNRRTTRRQAKARRHHFFDRLSAQLRRDEADVNSSELGAMLANSFLAYSTA